MVAHDPAVAADKDGVLEVLGKENCCVYAPYVLMRTYAVWRTLSILRIPGDVRKLVEATYMDIADESDLMRALKDDLERKRDRLRLRALASQDGSGLPVGNDTEEAATRYSDLPTVQVLLAETIDTKGRDDRACFKLTDGTELMLDAYRVDFNATRALHRSLVAIARYLLPSRQRARWLEKHFYEQPIVLVWNQENGALESLDGTATAMCYSPEYGVYRMGDTRAVPAVFHEDEGSDPFDDERFDW